MLTSLCVFCGSRAGVREVYQQAATELGIALAQSGIRCVYGGGNVGIMGLVADAVLAGGGEVTGVIPEALISRELAHAGVRDMRIVSSMHTRKALMAELSQGFVALPGGLGTYEELFEVLTWGQLGFHHKPVALLNVQGFYDPLIAMLDRAVEEGFMWPENQRLLAVVTSVPELLEYFRQSVSTESGAGVRGLA